MARTLQDRALLDITRVNLGVARGQAKMGVSDACVILPLLGTFRVPTYSTRTGAFIGHFSAPFPASRLRKVKVHTLTNRPLLFPPQSFMTMVNDELGSLLQWYGSCRTVVLADGAPTCTPMFSLVKHKLTPLLGM